MEVLLGVTTALSISLLSSSLSVMPQTLEQSFSDRHWCQVAIPSRSLKAVLGYWNTGSPYFIPFWNFCIVLDALPIHLFLSFRWSFWLNNTFILSGVDSLLKYHIYDKYLLGRGIWIKASCVIAAKWQSCITEIPKTTSVSVTENYLLNNLINK